MANPELSTKFKMANPELSTKFDTAGELTLRGSRFSIW